jgi:hypothetical protein
MKVQKLLVKLSVFISILSGSIWLGAYSTRIMISYQLFDFDMNLMEYVNEHNIEGILITITSAINTTFILYIIFIISFTVFLFNSSIKLKENGWIFIIAVIVYTTLPFEAYLMIIDYKLISILNFDDAIKSEYAINLIKERFTSLGSFPIFIILGYCSLIYFLLFKPFSRVLKDEN